MGPTALLPLRKMACWGFGRVWSRELEYQRPARLPLDHRSRYANISYDANSNRPSKLLSWRQELFFFNCVWQILLETFTPAAGSICFSHNRYVGEDAVQDGLLSAPVNGHESTHIYARYSNLFLWQKQNTPEYLSVLTGFHTTTAKKTIQ